MNEKEIKEFILAKKNPVSTCTELSKYFIGRHKILPIYLTPQFEKEFNNKMYELEKLKNDWKELKHFIYNILELKNDYIEKQLVLFLEKNGYNNLTIEELKKFQEKWKNENKQLRYEVFCSNFKQNDFSIECKTLIIPFFDVIPATITREEIYKLYNLEKKGYIL